MRLPLLALLGALLLPGIALAQTGGGAAATPIQRCEQNHQTCVRDCGLGANAQRCMAACAETRAYCIQNPSSALQPRR